MKNILLLTDFSENARNAIRYGIALFGADAQYTLLNSCTEPSMSTQTLFSVQDIIKKRSEEGLEEDLLFISESFPRFNLEIESLTKLGTIESILDEIEHRKSFDFVVIGTKGKTSDRWLVGSVAKTVVRHSHIPVIVVPNRAKFQTMNSVVYASDLKENESFLIEIVIQFAKLYDANLSILHVDTEPSFFAKSTLELEKIIRHFSYEKMKIVELIEDDIEDAIIDYITNNNVDLLAVTTYTTTLMKKAFHKSATKELMYHLQVPMLVFNRKKYSYIFLG